MVKRIHVFPVVIAILLFFLPFFWLKPGFVDIGGDGGRSYFLDPLTFLKSYSLYNMIPHYSYIPQLLLLQIIMYITGPGTYLIACMNGLKLSLAFFMQYLFIRKLFDGVKEGNRSGQPISVISATLGAFFYVSLISVFGWSTAYFTHNNVFINPLILYLLLSYFMDNKKRYLMAIVGVGFIFSPSFGFSGTPQFFSFFPIAVIFLLFYAKIFLKRHIHWIPLIIALVFFVGLQAFHLLPTIAQFADSGSLISKAVFVQDQSMKTFFFDLNRYSLGVLSTNIFSPNTVSGSVWFTILIPSIIIGAFIVKPTKLLLLLGFFWSLLFFLVSANITHIGGEAYRMLFFIPGFRMFMYFNEKWFFTYAFFYALLFSASLSLLLSRMKKITVIMLILIIAGSLVYRIFPFLMGSTVNSVKVNSNAIETSIKMDPDFLETIEYIKHLPSGGKVLTLPLTFAYFQLLYGTEGKGIYGGPSLILTLGGKQDYPGFWNFGLYENGLRKALIEGNTQKILQYLSLLHIKYIFHNSDPRIIDNFPGYPNPYDYPEKNGFPVLRTQELYSAFLSTLPIKRIFIKSFYSLYELDDASIRPLLYSPDMIFSSEDALIKSNDFRSAYAGESFCVDVKQDVGCDIQNENIPIVEYKELSPVHYSIRIQTKAIKTPFVVVLSQPYHNSWRMRVASNADIEVGKHIEINGYSNGWIIRPKKYPSDGEFEADIHLGFQTYVWVGMAISLLTIPFILGYIVLSLRNKTL